MGPTPREGTAAEGLSSTLLRFVSGESQIAQLRDGLGEFSHRCRNLLNGMKMSLYFVRRADESSLPAWWPEIEEGYQGIERIFETLQRIYRPMPLTIVQTTFGLMVQDRQRTWREWLRGSGNRLEIAPPAHEVPGGLDPSSLGMALDSFVHWRTRAMSSSIASLRWITDDDHFQVSWEEAGTAASLSEPPAEVPDSRRLPRAIGSDDLALPLLSRVMTAHGGELESNGEERQLQVRLRWPLRPSTIGTNAQPDHTAHSRT